MQRLVFVYNAESGIKNAILDSIHKTFSPSTYQEDKVDEMIDVCKTASVRERLSSIESLKERAAHTIIHMNYYPTRFDSRLNLYDKEYPRSQRLDLPFRREDFDGVVFLDEL